MADRTLEARELLRRFPLIDGHNDLPWTLRVRVGGDAGQVRLDGLDAPVAGTHTDLPRCRGVGASALCH